MLLAFASLVSGFATTGFKEIDGVQCASEIQPGVQAPSRAFVIGLAQEGATSPADGYGCTITGCGMFSKGHKSDDEGAFIMEFERGDALPSGSMGIIGCALPPNKDCMQAYPGFVASDWGIMAAFLGGNERAGTATLGGLWVDGNTGEVQEFEEGEAIPAGLKGMAVMGMEPGESMPDVPVEEAIFCPIELDKDDRRKLSLKRFKLTLDNLKKGHF